MIIILIPLFIEMTCFPVYTGMHFHPGLNARLAGKIEINPSPWQRTEIKKSIGRLSRVLTVKKIPTINFTAL